jgi:hypothetical protein
LRALLELYLGDNRQAWDLGADGRWVQRVPSGIVWASHELLLVNSWGIVEGGVGPGLWAVDSETEEQPTQRSS